MKKKKKLKLITYRITFDYTTTDEYTHPSKWMELDCLTCRDGDEAFSWVKSEEIATPDEHREIIEQEEK
ncbi:MAG: hypothetical protein EBR82_39425 [Caulobacteraceae bacterium]|nr:hypothetical protein [Caulobacteraceae bacterium]